MGSRMLRLASIVLLGGLLAAGCTPTEPVITPAPTAAYDPVFASDEEALAAAVEAYEAYLEVWGTVAAEGGENPERLKNLVTVDRLEREIESFAQQRSRGENYQSMSTVTDSTLQQYADYGDGEALIVIYACVDVSGSQMTDASGTVTEFTGMRPGEIAFEYQEGMKLKGVSPWQTDSC